MRKHPQGQRPAWTTCTFQPRRCRMQARRPRDSLQVGSGLSWCAQWPASAWPWHPWRGANGRGRQIRVLEGKSRGAWRSDQQKNAGTKGAIRVWRQSSSVLLLSSQIGWHSLGSAGPPPSSRIRRMRSIAILHLYENVMSHCKDAYLVCTRRSDLSAAVLANGPGDLSTGFNGPFQKRSAST